MIDAAVLDMHLNGDQVFRSPTRLAENGILFISASGYGSGDIPTRYSHVPRIDKPYSRRELIGAVAQLLG